METDFAKFDEDVEAERTNEPSHRDAPKIVFCDLIHGKSLYFNSTDDRWRQFENGKE